MRTCCVIALAIALSVALPGCDKAASDQGAGEIVALEHAPEAVRAMIERQRQGGNVGVIQRRVKNGKARYVVTIVQGDQEQRLSLTEDGRLISSRPAGDDEDDDD